MLVLCSWQQQIGTWEGVEDDAQQWMRIRSTEQREGEGEGLEHGRLADTHGIRVSWDSESEQMG